MPPKAANANTNGSITNFFKPVSASQTAQESSTSQASQAISQPASESPGRRHPSSPPPSSTTSLLNTPVKPAGPSRDAVIAASDDEDDEDASSDDELEDLMAKFDPRRNAAPTRSKPPQAAPETPKAKRKMRESFHSSPLTINPKHQFDMKALAKDALQDDATNASSLRNREAAEESAAAATTSRDDSGDAFLDIVQDKGGVNAHKVLRAVQRAAPGQSQLRYCFFESDYKPPSSSTVSKKVSTGPWRLLTHGTDQAREQYLVSGLPHTILKKSGGLPEEVFQWMLNEVCAQKSRLMQQEYCNLIESCPHHVTADVTPNRLQELLLRLGATEETSKSKDELEVSKPAEEPYQNRDWSCLRSFIELLARTSRDLSLPSVRYSLQMLLLMSMDKFLICNIDVLTEYENTIKKLLDILPHSEWDSFCSNTINSLHTNIKAQCIRINALLCLPISAKRPHELRRRLAMVFFFDDPALGGHHPDTVITIRGVIDRLNRDDFAVTSKTDFDELRASILLLNIAVDDGSFVTTGDLEDEKKFNDEIDELATKLREIWRKINDSGMKLARTEAKSVIEWVQQRISHSVRTKKKAKRGVFDTVARAEDPSLPRQQNYMKRFLGKPL